MKKTTIASILAAAYLGLAAPQSLLANEAVKVTLDNFVQAESTLYFNKNAQENNVPINEISHQRVMANIDVQENWSGIFRMYKPTDESEVLEYTSELLGNPVKLDNT